ncbi:putative N-acetyltransferase camello [Porphyridium purpureum]|uniref:Putative N-acetyltransferase camello n=1 Tax=Porphyridium purpureum TaxID=35688 RepID=A0A5J4ZA72_PORPP|nr:putative N-acetyltransferase camello [Porphyridium purpureum]|eukprot:POR9009..scf295_1
MVQPGEEEDGGSDLVVRSYTHADREWVVEQFRAAMREMAKPDERVQKQVAAYTESCVTGDLSDVPEQYDLREAALGASHGPRGHFWICVRSGEPECRVGMVGLRRVNPADLQRVNGSDTARHNDEECQHVAELLRFSVARDARRLGAGSRLLKVLIQHAKEQGFRVVKLESLNCMAGARRLYEKEGFRIDARRPLGEVPVDVEHIVSMTLNL